MHERLEAIVSGRVQMVMYRDFAQRKARGLKLVGDVLNLRDGTVRVRAEGPRESLEKYLAKLHKGPLLAHVEHVESEWKEATGEYQDFTILYG
jgi:acylphosphatase